jgi:hypothetical protein
MWEPHVLQHRGPPRPVTGITLPKYFPVKWEQRLPTTACCWHGDVVPVKVLDPTIQFCCSREANRVETSAGTFFIALFPPFATLMVVLWPRAPAAWISAPGRITLSICFVLCACEGLYPGCGKYIYHTSVSLCLFLHRQKPTATECLESNSRLNQTAIF